MNPLTTDFQVETTQDLTTAAAKMKVRSMEHVVAEHGPSDSNFISLLPGRDVGMNTTNFDDLRD